MSSALRAPSTEHHAAAGAVTHPTAPVVLEAPRDPTPAARVPGRRRTLLSLRWIVPGVAAGVLAGALMFAGSAWERDSQSVLLREVEARLVLEARHLALTSAAALLDPFPELTLQPFLRDLMRSRPDLESVIVLDRAGLVLGHPSTDRLGQSYVAPSGLTPVASQVPLQAGEALEEDRALLVARSPVRIPSGEIVGTAIVRMHRSYLEAAVEETRQRRTLLTTALLGLGAFAMVISMVLLLRPVGRLRSGIERLGRGDLDTPIAIRDRTEFGMLADTLNRMAVEIREAQRQSLERERLAREMELARNLQRSLLPSRSYEAADFVLVGSQAAAAEVGGDYFDVVPLDGGRVGFAIADVSGKGMGGCLVMTMLSALLRGLRDLHPSPAGLLVAIDRSLSASLPRGGFVTMTYGTLDPACGEVTLASAGHLPAIIYRAASAAVEWKRATAPPVGALRRGGLATLLTDERITLGPGDLLVQITDGYQEAPAPGTGETFEFARIEAVIKHHGHEGPEAVIRALDQAVAAWAGEGPARDDQTVLVVGCTGRPDGAVRTPVDSIGMDLSEPLALLARLEQNPTRLALEGSLDELPRIRGWLRERLAGRPLLPGTEPLLENALYEACANIIEHGLAGRRPTPVDLWWMLAPAAGADSRAELFVIRDHGAPFDPSRPSATDLDDPQARRRGRGLGLAMIHRIMTRVAYAGGTPEGNLTILMFDPARLSAMEGGLTGDRTA